MIRVLIVGSETSAAALAEPLVRAGHLVECATDTDVEAVVARAAQCLPEAIVIALSDSQSLAFIARLRADPTFESTACVVLSSTPLEDARGRALLAGGADLCLLWDDHEALPQWIKRLSARQAAAQQAGDAWYRASFESNPQPMWVYDLESLRFLVVNDAAVMHYGYSREEFLRMTIADIRPAEDLPRMYATIHAAAKGINQSGVWRHIKRNGELVYVEIASCPLTYNGRRAKLVMVNDVSERQRAEAELRDREDRLRLAIQAANVGLWDWNIGSSRASYSLEWKRLLGYEDHEIGDDIEEWRSRVHPDDLGPTLEYMARNFKSPDKQPGIEFRMRHKKGSWRWIYSRGKVIRDAAGNPVRMIGGNVDITARKEAEERIRRLNRTYAVLSDINQLIVRERDTATLLTQACRIAKETGGFSFVWIGMSPAPGQLEVAAHAGGSPDTVEGLKRAYADPTQRCAFTSRALDTGVYAVCNDIAHDPLAAPWREAVLSQGLHSMASFPLYVDGRVVGVFNLYADCADFFDAEEQRLLDELSRDIGYALEVSARETERRALEQQLAQLQKLQAIGTLAGGIAHDFNNVLAAIIGNARLAKQDLPADHAAQKSVEEILRAGLRARDLVQRILTFSRPQEKALKLLRLDTVVEEAVRLLRPTIPAGIALRLTSADQLPDVCADASQIHQVVLNLITNAWHALQSPNGCIDIRLEVCEAGEAQCQAHPDLRLGRYVRLSVHDTGIGMDAATRARIFEPFFTTKRPGQGVGLGLAVVHGIVRAHGGAIVVESEPGRGSTFHVYFPVAAEPALRTDVVNALTSEESEQGHGERILFIDDEEPLVDLTVRFLQQLGYRVDGHTQPATALATYRAHPQDYDLVITDYNMPGMSGVEVAKRILEVNRAARIVLVSGYLRPGEIDQARALGVCDIVLKPNTIAELGSCVRQWLIKRSAAA